MKSMIVTRPKMRGKGERLSRYCFQVVHTTTGALSPSLPYPRVGREERAPYPGSTYVRYFN